MLKPHPYSCFEETLFGSSTQADFLAGLGIMGEALYPAEVSLFLNSYSFISNYTVFERSASSVFKEKNGKTVQRYLVDVFALRLIAAGSVSDITFIRII